MLYQCPSNEGWGPISPTNPAHLTTCFQHGVLTVGLNMLFLVAAAVRLRKLNSMPSLPTALVTGWLFSTKLVLATAVMLASTAELVAMAMQFPYIGIYSLSLALQTAAAAVAVHLHYKEQLHNRIASTPLLLFWLFSFLLSLLRLRTAMSANYANDFNGLARSITVFTVAALAVFVLECQPKPDKLFEMSGDNADAVNSSGFGKLEDSDNDYCTSGSPEERANVFSRYTYTWVGSLLQKGYQKQLQLEDIWKLAGQYRPDVAHTQFQKSWQKELKSSSPSLFLATARAYWPIWALIGIHTFLKTAASILQPILLSLLIGFSATYGTDQGSPIEHGYFYAVALFLVACEMTIGRRLLLTQGQRIKTLARTGYMTTIYQKLFALSNTSRQKHDINRIITHITVDLENIAVFLGEESHNIWCDPLRIIVCLLMLYRMLGWSALAGVFVMLVCGPVISRIGQTIIARSKLLIGYRDQRMGIINEMLAGIRVIKMNVWESSFTRRINDVRINLELDATCKNNSLKAITWSATNMVPYLVLFTIFGTYTIFKDLSRGSIDARLVFVSIPLLNLIRLSLRRAPRIIPNIITTRRSFRRITKFLTATEIYFSDIDRQPYIRDSPAANVNDLLVNVNNATFKWSAPGTPALRNIIIQCKRKELIAIIGRVGCGKSSLASAILGDMIKCAGDVTVRGSIAYVAQQPRILNTTLRENILFGSEYEQELYERVVDACALQQVIDSLSAGDSTEIGENGISLSSDQNMRVSLARAVYARADVYILDDPLAAVDAHIGEHLFNNVIGPQGILRARARVLVTHSVEYLDHVDNIVMLRDGRIIERGTAAEAMGRHGDIFDFVHHQIAAYSSTKNNSVASADEYNGPDANKYLNISENQWQGHADANSTGAISTQRDKHTGMDVSSTQFNNADRTMIAESRQDGEIKWNTYRNYIKSSGLLNVFITILAFLVAVAAEVCAKLWLKHWTSSNANTTPNVTLATAQSSFYYLFVFGALGLLAMLATLLEMLYIWTKCSTRTSTVIHQNMLTGVLRSPMSFFDTTPTSRILNRFSSDVQKCDEALPNDISLLTDGLFNIIITVSVVAILTPAILPILVLLTNASYRYQRLYIRTSRKIRRLDSTTRSSIYAHFQETASGTSTIRAYGQQSRYISEMEHRVGQCIRVDNALLLLNQWLSMRLETIGNIVTLATALLIIAFTHYSGSGDAGTIGLAVGSTLMLSITINWTAEQYGDMQISMTHFERATEYTELLPEADDVIEDHRPKESWPEQGMVEFKNYSMRYRDGLDLVLKDLSFRVQPRQKVAIVGRTGAGKSSLTLALFRIVEAASGQILLDGEDIFKYGLFDVRSKLSIIPQDPVLFAGTIRENLDPFNNYNDQDIWRVLEQAHLADYIRSKDERLEFMMTQDGENFSVEQRQLICLARALLKHAKVLVLIETKATLHSETDSIIQQAIRSEFKDCTVLTIAHRLDTVIDSDMVLVIDEGKLAEYDTPHNLLANKGSMLSKLIKEAVPINT
ncbi:hypothetical protein H4R24_001824 [Coemansia sp. RSA 988]|nr:hypothetical protein H4R24_001824 [Coemansia sp. RSA 988]